MAKHQTLMQRVETFRSKVSECEQTFDIQLFYSVAKVMLKEVNRYEEIGIAREIVNFDSVTQIRSRYLTYTGNAKAKDITTEYFNWYFVFLSCLRDLYNSFVVKIYTPLRDFYQLEKPEPKKDDRTVSRMSFLSMMSEVPETDVATQTDDDGKKVLGNWYEDTGRESIAERLKYLVDRVGVMVDDEDDINEELFNQDSANKIKMIERDDLDTDGISDALLRLVPDILLKLNNAGKLAYRWLSAEENRERLGEERFSKVKRLEDNMMTKISPMTKTINYEEELAISREEWDKLHYKSGNVDVSLYDHDKRINIGETFLESLRNDQFHLKNRYTFLSLTKPKPEKDQLKALKIAYEKTKLRVLNWEMDLAKLKFQRSVAAEDIQLRMELAPGIAVFQDYVRDKLAILTNELDESENRVGNVQPSSVTPFLSEDSSDNTDDVTSKDRSGSDANITNNETDADVTNSNNTDVTNGGRFEEIQ